MPADLIYPDWQNKSAKKYTKTKSEPVIEINESELTTMEAWATEVASTALETNAMTPNPDPMNSLIAGIPYTAIPEDGA